MDGPASQHLVIEIAQYDNAAQFARDQYVSVAELELYMRHQVLDIDSLWEALFVHTQCWEMCTDDDNNNDT